jgi:hypothetical protein
MDPLSITVASLIATYAAQAFGGQLGQSAASGLQNLLKLVRRKFSGDPSAQAALTAISQSPQAPEGVDAFARTLDNSLKSDAEFRRLLDETVNAMRSDSTVDQFITTVSGNATVGKITNIGTVTGEVNF